MDDSSSSSEDREREWSEWSDILRPFVDKEDTWLTAPWMVTEFYVYRRLLIDVIRYWDEYEYEYEEDDDEDGKRKIRKKNPGYLYDPFEKQKHAGLVSSVGSAEGVLGKINNLKTESESESESDVEEEGGGGERGLRLATSI